MCVLSLSGSFICIYGYFIIIYASVFRSNQCIMQQHSDTLLQNVRYLCYRVHSYIGHCLLYFAFCSVYNALCVSAVFGECRI